jgi:tetratricopeptide (TPR) repeat protein
MNAWLERQVQVGTVAAPARVSAETEERLKALGYVGTAGAPALAASDLPDPKDKIADAERLKDAIRLRAAGQLAQAVARYREVLADNPRMIDAWQGLGQSLADLGRSDQAIAAFDRVIELDPARPGTHLALARLHGMAGRADRARQHAEVAAEGDPGGAHELLAQLAMDRGDVAQAAAHARRSVAADDRREVSHFLLGVAAQRQGRCEEALQAFGKAQEAVQLRPQAIVRNLHASRGDCLARLGRHAEAERAFLAEIELIPHSREGRVGLATLYRSLGRDAEARAALGGLVEASGDASADTYWTVVRTFSVLGDVEAAREWAARARARFPGDRRFRDGRG